MKKNFKVNCIGLLLLVIFAVFVSFYFTEQMQIEYFNGRQKACSSYSADKCPSNCYVKTDQTKCAGNSKSSSMPWNKNNVPSGSYANTPGASYSNPSSYSSTQATCGTGGYLKTCATKGL